MWRGTGEREVQRKPRGMAGGKGTRDAGEEKAGAGFPSWRKPGENTELLNILKEREAT